MSRLNKLISVIALVTIIALVNCSKRQSKMNCEISSIQDLKNLFPKTVSEIDSNFVKAKNLIDETVNKIVSLADDQRTYPNTVKTLDDLSEKLAYLTNVFPVLEFVSPEKELRDAAHETLIKLNKFTIEKIGTNKKLYQALKYYYENQFKNEELSKEEKYYLEEEIKAFKKGGLDLPDEELQKVRILLNEINELRLNYEQNVNNDDSKLEFTKKELQGTPEQVINALQKTSGGKYIVKTDYPTVFGILQHCKIQETRKKVSNMFNNRAFPKNYDILKELMVKQHQLAKLLGYKDFAHLDIDNQMAETPEKVKSFINNLIEKAKIKAKKEIALFTKDIKDKDLFDKNGKIKPWNLAFIKEEYKKKYLNLDDKEITKYFPMQNTIDELLDIYHQFLNVNFKEVNVEGFWHVDVKLIEVHKTNNLIGYLLLDLHPRDNKYSHACDVPIIPGVKKDNKLCPAVSLVIANFTKPTKDSPSLLTLSEALTFFHEFGHAMHDILGRTKIASFAGSRTKSDFVELPSQMLENWLQDKAILKKITKHYQTGKPLPDKLIENIEKLEKLDSGDFTLNQLAKTLVSLNIFDDNPHKDIKNMSKDIHYKIRDYVMWNPENNHLASFGHLANDGYASKYYGYMWSNVFAHDVFHKIKRDGLLNGKIGQEYIDKIIGKGGSQDPNELLEDFLGRKPNEKAFMQDMGFIQ